MHSSKVTARNRFGNRRHRSSGALVAGTALVAAFTMVIASCGSSGGASGASAVAGNSSSASSQAAAGNTGATGSSGAVAASGGPIELGQIASLTGNYTPLGTNNKLGADLAVQQINDAGGVLGRPLKISVKDDQSSPDQAVIAFNDLASTGVAAVIGSSNSNASLAVIPIAERKKISYISTAAADEQIDPVRSFGYMTTPTAGVIAEQLLRYFKAKGMTKMAVAYNTQQAYAVTGWKKMEALADKYGISFVDKETFETSMTDFASVLTHVSSSGAQGLMVWVTGAPAVIITKQMATSGPKIPLIFSPAEASTLYTKPAGSAAVGVILACSVASVGPDLPASKLKDTVMAMATAFQKANGTYPPQFAFDGYDAVELIAAAIKKADSADPVKVQQALDTLTLLAPEGTYHLSPTDHSGLTVDDVAIAVVKSDGSLSATDWSKQELAKTLK
ncbi:MAG: ABC transporter substrate-binding protein [Nakamurella sp.]